jgi:hypothetical protein
MRRPNQAQAIEGILRAAHPDGMTADEVAQELVGVADGNRVRHNLNWLVEQGHVRRGPKPVPYRYYAVRR